LQGKIKSTLRRIFKKRFARFFVVGVWNTLVDLSILSLMISITGAKPDETLKLILCNTVSGTFSIASSFLLNRYFVFRDGKNPVQGKKLITFIVVSLIGAYGINNTVLNVVVLHADWLHEFIYPIIEFIKLDGIITQNMAKIFTGKAVAGLSSMLWSFWAYGKFVFKQPAENSQE
jgi:putative flippase GtrA